MNQRYNRTTGSVHHTAISNSASHFHGMGTIMEDDDHPEKDTRGGYSAMSKNYSNLENENFANRSANPLEESIADPGRAPQRLEGLTSFLIEEYYRRYGIYT